MDSVFCFFGIRANQPLRASETKQTWMLLYCRCLVPTYTRSFGLALLDLLFVLESEVILFCLKSSVSGL